MSLAPEQLEQRQKGIGSSEIPAILGLVPWQGPIDVWLAKTGRAEPSSSLQADIGDYLEIPIANIVADALGVEITRWQETLTHRTCGIALATPDFSIHRDSDAVDAVLEIKNVGHRVLPHWDDVDCPDYVVAQVQWQLEVTEISTGWVGALLGGRDLRTVELQRDAELGAAMLEVAEDFWRKYVVADVAPPIDGSRSAREYLKRRFASHGGEVVAAPEEANHWARQYFAAARDEKDAKARKDEAHNRLAALIADNGGIHGPWGRAVWVETKEQEVSFIKEANRYVRVSPSKEAKQWTTR